MDTIGIIHKQKEIIELSLFNSNYEYADGYSRIVCSCGWSWTGRGRKVTFFDKLDNHVSQEVLKKILENSFAAMKNSTQEAIDIMDIDMMEIEL